MDKDPVTGRPYPSDAIQRILYVTKKVHVYRIPPITSTKGFNAASWTQNPKDLIFTCRLRVVETAIPPPANAPADASEKVFVNILLEDPNSGQLFAAAPYTNPHVVEQALDSSRFFAIRVAGEGGMKATLGIGWEERPEAFDFGVCLQDVRRILGMDPAGGQAGQAQSARRGPPGRPTAPKPAVAEVKRDFSLKEGETITVNIGGKSRIGKSSGFAGQGSTGGGGLFAIPPPPGKSSGSGSASVPVLPPPPSASDVKSGATATDRKQPTAEELGFDDGEFGEFQ
ncbi:uncharacterized protein PV09_06781 [Verruconis gallopava]|uniref:NECAP PHear domain-containing protein n=1 Tax=Verruconis gallopava TaxID=253628 RepID=A0A0D2A5C3_9PEZI|nr:uncharacterized protein PV09_06781 [Verruconis gallopava]KIW01943.1 hypothetical protein PV09_06781 [Verruconis gallopava]